MVEQIASLYLYDSPTSSRAMAPGLPHQTDSNRHDSPGTAILALVLNGPPPASQPTPHATRATGR